MKVTFATMLLYEGGTGRTVYGIYRGIVRGRGDKRYINLNARTSSQVAKVEYTREKARPSYLDMVKPFATDEYPAFDFGRN